MTDLQERLMNKVELVPPSSCWLWMGAVSNRNTKPLVPAMKYEGKVVNARRVFFEAFVGEIWDEKLRVIVRCGGDLCVNPIHIDFLEPAEFCSIGRASQMRHWESRTTLGCGHPLTEENISRRSLKGLRCRTCHRMRNLRYKRSLAKKPRPHLWRDT